MMIGPCEHCPNPDKALWQTECLYKGHYLTHRAFVRSNFDPPCAVDEAEQEIRAARRRGMFETLLTSGVAALLTIGTVAVITLIFVGIKQL